MAQNLKINAEYVRGLFETDGSITMEATKAKRFSATCSIGSTTDRKILYLLRDWLESKNIKATVTPKKEPARCDLKTPITLKITGDKTVEQFLTLLETDKQSGFVFCGGKQRDYLLLRTFLDIKKQAFAQNKKQLPSWQTQALLLSIKKSLHKANYLIEDFRDEKTLTFEEYEMRLDLTKHKNDPLKPANDKKIETILQGVDAASSAHQVIIRAAIRDKNLVVSPSFVAGVVDGDGSFYITISWTDPKSATIKSTMKWGGCFTLSKNKNSVLLFELLKYVLKLPPNLPVKPILSEATKDTTKAIGSYQMWVRSQPDMTFLLQYFMSGILCNPYRILQYESVIKLKEMRLAGALKKKRGNLDGIKALLTEVYAVSLVSTKGRARKPLLIADALQKTDIWLVT